MSTGKMATTAQRVASEGGRLQSEFREYGGAVLFLARERDQVRGQVTGAALAKLRSYVPVFDEWIRGLTLSAATTTSPRRDFSQALLLWIELTRDFYVEKYLPLVTLVGRNDVTDKDFNAAAAILFGSFDNPGAHAIVEKLIQGIVTSAEFGENMGRLGQELYDFNAYARSLEGK